MKQFVITLIIALCSTVAVNAQTYTERLQKKVPGQGTVVITQSKEIDELVNGNNRSKQNTQQSEKPQQKIKAPSTKPIDKDKNKVATKTESHSAAVVKNNNETTATHESEAEKRREAVAEKERHHEVTPKKEETVKHDTVKKEEAVKHDTVKKEEAVKHDTAKKEVEEGNGDDGMDIPVVDLRKKVMRKSYKVTGYRVQAFAGGNSRQDKIKAQQIGNNLKMQFPDQPIYVHFYSPRWICRVGNYRSYEEADRMLRAVHKMGYKSASIVRGKITVQY
jgi:hypothetical protein